MSASARLYNCEDCKAVGVKRDSVTRPRVATGEIGADGKPIKVKRAFCQPHFDAYKGIDRDRDRDAEAHAYVLLAADNGHLWNVADRASRARAEISPLDRERLADVIRDRFVAMVVADLQEDGTLAHKGATMVPAQVMAAATRSHVNLSRDLRGEAIAHLEGEETTGRICYKQAGISWDPEVLAALDPMDALTLIMFANADEADTREPNRNEASMFIAGRMIDARTVSDRVRAAASAYLAAKATLAAY